MSRLHLIGHRRMGQFRIGIAGKLLLALATTALLTAAAVGGVAYWKAKDAIEAGAEDVRIHEADARAQAVIAAMERHRSGVEMLATMPSTLTGLTMLSEAMAGLDPASVQVLQSLGQGSEPLGDPSNRKERAVSADLAEYGQAYAKVNPSFEMAGTIYGWQDLLLINSVGDVIYSLAKGQDFASNLKTGPWLDRNLAEFFQDLEALPPDRSSALAPLQEQEGKPMILLGAPLRDAESGFLGALVVRLASAPIDALLSGQALEDRDGRVVPVDYLGQRLFLPLSPAEDPADPQLWAVAWQASLTSLFAGLIAACGGLFLGQMLAHPLVRMAQATDLMGKGEGVALPAVVRGDEVGALARSLEAASRREGEAMRIRTALDGAGVPIMVAGEDGRILHVNQAMSELLARLQGEIAAILPGFTASGIVGQGIPLFHEDRAYRTDVLAHLKEPQETQLKIGRHTIKQRMNPVHNTSGARIAVSIEWLDITDWLDAQDEVGKMVEGFATGDFSRRLPLERKEDGMCTLAQGLNEISTLVERAVDEFGEGLHRLAGGDLTCRIETAYMGRFEELKGSFNQVVDRLAATMGSVQSTSGEIRTAASEINAGAEDLASRTERQASNLEETAATTEELSASVRQSAEQSVEAARLAAEAKDIALHGSAVAGEAVAAMERIEQASNRIADIIGVIDDIAFQTNLLALNAAVEAARAGEAGRGFAVVASEVRTLAQRSAEAAKDIKTLIMASGEEVAGGVELVRTAGHSLEQITAAAERVAETVAAISAASGEQANGIHEISQTVASMDEMTQQNSALAEESAASAKALAERIAELNRQVTFFRLGKEAAPALSDLARPALASRPPALPRRNGSARETVSAGLHAREPVPSKPGPNGHAQLSEADWTEF